MSYENFSYQIGNMKKNKELNELTKALNSGIDEDVLYKAFRDLYTATVNSRLVRGKDGLNLDGLFVDVNTEDAIYSLLDVVKGYLSFNLSKMEAIDAALNLTKEYYLLSVSEEERSRHLTHMNNLKVGLEGNAERARLAFWNMLKADLTMKVNELIN